MSRADLTSQQLDRTIREMNKAFPSANVVKYKSLISSLKLPDAGDRHVLAAAVRSRADVIVTSNVKDFPKPYLEEFDIDPQHPDVFISNLIDLNPAKAKAAFLQQITFLKNPPRSELQVLEALRKCGLRTCVERLSNIK